MPRWPKLPKRLAYLPDILLVAAVLLGMHAWQTRDTPTGAAPALVSTTVSGEPVSLADYRGKPVMLHFWATWCAACKAVQPNVIAVASDLPVLTVASRSGDAVQLAQYLHARPLRFPVVVDPTGELAARFGVRAFPTSFVLDADGDVRHVDVGYTTELGLRLRMWLAGL